MRNVFYTFVAIFVLLLSGCADAGEDQEVKSGDTVTLDGSQSTPDNGGEIVRYKWKQLGVPKVMLLDSSDITPTFIAPITTERVKLMFKLATVEKYDCKKVGNEHQGEHKKQRQRCKKNITNDKVNIFVEPADDNTPPVASPQNIITDKGASVSIKLNATDVDADTLTYRVTTQPSNATLSGTAPNLTYTPSRGFSGTDSFTFVANDTKIDSEPATISITVNDVVEVVNGYTLPPKPDATLNDSTLLGIDVNDNGVRDDVERWIVKKYKDHHKIVTEIGFQSARAFNAVIENPVNAQETHKIEDAAYYCNSYFSDYADIFGEPILLDHAIDLESIQLNTKERINAYLTYDLALSGGVYSLPPAHERKKFCDFDVEYLLGGGK